MKILKRSLAAVSAAAIAVGTFGTVSASADTVDITEMRDITTMELVREMGIGINLGNTFESCGDWINSSSVTNYETGWGSPKITQKMIQGYADEGFGVLRIPVAWSNMMGDDYTIDSSYIDRVKEVAEWAMEADLYVIINLHWDSGWLNDFPNNEEEYMYRYTRIWTQLCDGFKEYGDHLMFESQNEELGSWNDLWNQWSSDTTGKADSYDLVNRINQNFVDIVRGSGGNNAKRHLLISGFSTNIDRTCDELFKMPEDPENRCAVSVHYYDPFNFTHGENSTWGSNTEYSDMNKTLDKMKKNFVDKGIPVIIGECGMGSYNKEKPEGEISKYVAAVCEAIYSRNMCPVIWDINYTESNKKDRMIYDRNQAKMVDSDLKAALNEISAQDVKKDTTISVESSFEVTYKDPSFNLNATADSGAALKYSTSNSKVATVDADGNVTIVGAGNAVITVSAEGTDEYLPAAVDVTVTVNKIASPPTTPDKQMTVQNSVSSTSQIELPEGWSWVRKVELTEGETTTARAVYDDANYGNRSVDIEIYRNKPEEDSSSSQAPANSSSADSNSSNSSSSSTSGSTSSGSSSSKASSSATTTSTTTSTSVKNDDKAAPTGIGGGLTGLAAILAAGAVLTVAKKKGE